MCFFFDPEKPGTTGESLRVFTQVLGGVEHKLLLCMNKIDTLKTTVDLARTFGTLCWNLSKVIPTKDMPFVHLSFIPNHGSNSKRTFDLTEFDGVRDEIVSVIKAAPKKRADNIVVEMQGWVCLVRGAFFSLLILFSGHAENLLLHARVLSQVRLFAESWCFLLTRIIRRATSCGGGAFGRGASCCSCWVAPPGLPGFWPLETPPPSCALLSFPSSSSSLPFFSTLAFAAQPKQVKACALQVYFACTYVV